MSIVLLPPVLAAAGSVALSILGIGFLIFVHELGHYLACRLTRTRVETFSIGFGTRLFGWENLPGQPRRLTVGRRRLDPSDHAMDFRIALVPLGGFVKMAGENPGEERSDAPDEFPNKSFGARATIILAGVVMNVLAAGLFYFIAYAGHVEQPPAVVGAVQPGGPAWQAGLEPGDRILSLGGEKVRSFLDLKMETVFLDPDHPAAVEIDRGGERKSLDVVPRYDEEGGMVQLQVQPAVGLRIVQDGATFEVGATDEVDVAGIRARGGREVLTTLLAAWSAQEGGSVPIRRPGGEVFEVVFRPDADAPTDARIGVEPFGHPRVTDLRGEARELLRVDDRLLAAETSTGRVLLDRPSRLDSLPFQAPVSALQVRRGEETLDLPVDLASPAAVEAFLDAVATSAPTDAVVAPTASGVVSPLGGGGVGRYPSSPAAVAGLRDGETIVQVGDQAVATWNDVLAAVNRAASRPDAGPLQVHVKEGGGEPRPLSIPFVRLEPLAPGVLTLVDVQEPVEVEGVVDAMGMAVKRTGSEISNIFRMIKGFFTGTISFQRNVAGPATIVVVSSSAAERSILVFLLFLAYISVTLAVLNVLPIPVLDGGHLVFLLIEKIKGSPLKPETLGRLSFVGMMLLLVLMFFAFRNDVYNLLQ